MTGHSGPGSQRPDPDGACLDDASYVLGSLTPQDRLGYEKHLAGCLRCQASVQRLAGLPGLLALIGPADVSDLDDSAEVVAGTPGTTGTTGTGTTRTAGREPAPPSLLTDLLARVAAERRRRRWIVGAVSGLAAACAIVLAVVLIVRPGSGTGSVAAPGALSTSGAGTKIALTPVVPGPMYVTVALENRKWGTSITMNCDYEGAIVGSTKVIGYELEVMDRQGRVSGAGSWRAAGAHAVVIGASSLHPAEIASLRVTLDDGTVILRGTP